MSAPGGRRTAVFCMSVAHSVSLQALFAAAGVAAEHVDGGTPTLEREAILRRFESGETQVLCNCLIASIGFNLPELDCIQLARPTKSLAMYLQMLGRRPAHGAGQKRLPGARSLGLRSPLGFAHDERFWTLDGHADMARTVQARERSEGKEVTCPECARVYTGGRTCPSCGHTIKPKGKMIETLDGELVEVGAHLEPDDQDRLRFYLELRGHAAECGFKPGFAAHKFKEKFGGGFPPWAWNDMPAAMPSRATRGWLQSRHIAYAKAMEKVT